MSGVDQHHALNPSQQAVLDQLAIKEPREFAADLAVHLRSELERDLAPLVRHLEEDETVMVSKATIERVLGCERKFLAEDAVQFEWSVPMARGLVTHKAIEISVVRKDVLPSLDVIDEAIARLQNGGNNFADWLTHCTEAELDEIRIDANNRFSSFCEAWPPIKRQWFPATEMPLRVELFEGRVTLQGKPDLTLGRARGCEARKVIVDFKTGKQHRAHRNDMRFYGLLDAIKIGTPPRLLVTAYLDSAANDTEVVTEETLELAINRTADATNALVELRHAGRPAVERPGPSCRWCTELAQCESGQAFVANDDDI